ncbi:heme-binding protein [Dyella marensis]|uniref:heme-binding protein n=1 Tax=Dyella marensis TaxID=500610 RepID=UPI003C2B5C02
MAGIPLHIVHRGVNRCATFIDDEDRRHYLALLGRHARRQGVNLHAYVLMGNHVHLLTSSDHAGATSAMMHRVGLNYVAMFNYRHRRTGTLWEGRFKSCPVACDRYLLAAYRYIELNPVRAALSEKPEDYAWSSARGNLGLRRDALLTPHASFLSLASGDHGYRRWLERRKAGAIRPFSLGACHEGALPGKVLFKDCGHGGTLPHSHRANRALPSHSTPPAGGLMKTYLMFALLLPGLAFANESPQVLLQPNMSLALARQLATDTQARCAAQGTPIAVTVVDRAGQVVVTERGDNVGPHNVDASRRKAYTALSTRMITSEFAERVLASPQTAALANLPELLLVGGGMPIRAGDQVIGAVGVAGSGSPQLDLECITGVKAPELDSAAKHDKAGKPDKTPTRDKR